MKNLMFRKVSTIQIAFLASGSDSFEGPWKVWFVQFADAAVVAVEA